jgi:hypothetical protein
MGSLSGVTKALKHLFRAMSAEELHRFLRLIDGSYVLYAISRQNKLGYEMFTLDPHDKNAVKAVVTKIVECMKTFLGPFAINKHNSVFFFEGSISKRRHASFAKVRNSLLTKALRLRQPTRVKNFRQRDPILEKRKKASITKITKAYGRPKPWLTQLVAKALAEEGYHVDYSSNVESDFRICKFASYIKRSTSCASCTIQDHGTDCALYLNQREVMVVGADTDFIALSPENSVDALAKKVQGTLMVLRKDAVLEDLGFNEFQLLLAYCIGGCDNVPTHFHNYGWKKAEKDVAKSDLTKHKLLTLQKLPFNAGKASERVQIVQDIITVLRDFGWIVTPGAPAEMQQLSLGTPEQQPLQTDEKAFALELDANGKLVRPRIFTIVMGTAPNKGLLPAHCLRSSVKPQTQPGARAPTVPGPRKMPENENSFFVLSTFTKNADYSYENGLHKAPDERQQWLDERAAARQGDVGAADIAKSKGKGNQGKKREATSLQQSGTSDKRKRTSATQDIASSSNTSNDTATPSHADSSNSVETPAKAKAKKPKPPSKKRTPTDKKNRLGFDDAKTEATSDATDGANTDRTNNASSTRPKASDDAKRGRVNPNFGKATIPLQDRKTLKERYTPFTENVGKLEKSIVKAVAGVSEKYGCSEMVDDATLAKVFKLKIRRLLSTCLMSLRNFF